MDCWTLLGNVNKLNRNLVELKQRRNQALCAQTRNQTVVI
jgi:hypothetical protein